MSWLLGAAAAAVFAVSAAVVVAEPTSAAPSGGKPHKVEYVAHRGASYEMPENTLVSYNTAWKNGTDACENDIQLTKDGKVIVLHDADTLRTTTPKDGGQGTKLLVKDATADELRALDVGSFKGPQFKGEKIPYLDECLATIPAGKRFFIEIKSGTDVVPAAVEIIKKSGKTAEQVPMISFHSDALAEAKQALPDHKCYLLAGAQREKGTRKVIGWHMLKGGKAQNVATLADVIRVAKDIHADGVDLDYNGPLGEHPGEVIHGAGLEFYVWTVDDPEVARKMIAEGVDGITTNRHAWLKEQVEGGK